MSVDPGRMEAGTEFPSDRWAVCKKGTPMSVSATPMTPHRSFFFEAEYTDSRRLSVVQRKGGSIDRNHV